MSEHAAPRPLPVVGVAVIALPVPGPMQDTVGLGSARLSRWLTGGMTMVFRRWPVMKHS
jgi:hypothetical protein